MQKIIKVWNDMRVSKLWNFNVGLVVSLRTRVCIPANNIYLFSHEHIGYVFFNANAFLTLIKYMHLNHNSKQLRDKKKILKKK